MRILSAITLAALLLFTACAAAEQTAKPATEQAATIAFALGDGRLAIVQAPFDRMRAKILGCRVNTLPCLIDGRVPYGATAGNPRTYVQKITFSRKGRTFVLPSDGMFDALTKSPSPEDVKRSFGVACDEDICTIRAAFSDASETFVVQWRIVSGIATREIISGEPDIVDYIMDNLVAAKDNL
jgi:hypothetical protein